jgi:DNA-binding winged helix-turn-helix (wHTH) protein/TolB-like protein/Flp pilus assembly protein TadD
MPIDGQTKVMYEFGVFQLDPDERLLLCRGEAVQLTPRAFDTLLLLVENSGHRLRKDELIEKLWPDSFVGENSLAQNISALRKALDEGPDGQQYIETLPKLGYRFTAPVNRVERERSQPPASTIDAEAAATAITPDLDESTGTTPATAIEPKIAQQPELHDHPARESGAHRRSIIGVAALLGLTAIAVIAYVVFARKAQPPPAPTSLRLAVLPFRNLKQDKDTDFLGFSLADAVITKLRLVKILITRPSAYVEKYRNQTIDPRQVADELQVEMLLTGSFIKEGDDLRITAQLVDVNRNEFVWQDTMDLKYDKLATVQDEVTARVIQGLQLNLSPTEKENLSRDTPANALAYEYFLHGVDLYSRNDFSTATNMLEKTVSLDPNYALAWAHLGRAYNAAAAFALEGHNANEKASAAYKTALKLNPEQVESRIFMANTFTDTGRVDQAVALLRKTIDAHPNLAEAHWELGYAYRFGGMLEESIAECERARQLDPKVKIYSSAINSYLYLGDYTKFLQSLPQTESIAYILFYRGFGNYYLKNWSTAAADFDRAFQLDPSLYVQVGAALSKSIHGNKDEGLALVRDLDRKIEERNVRDAEGVYKVAQAYAVLGDKPSALRVLRRAIEGGFFCYPYFVSDPVLENVRHEAEFATLMELARQRHEAFKKEFFPSK